ncbi:unnamed protein product [Lupinus luteus]|uniref:Uncharacterized protein n=1 Tax=Lupinus luteus TaxID=3873 RepID=A0AAV1XE24_LUPLU
MGNLEHCAKFLNQSLMTFGFPTSLDLFANDPVSIKGTCNDIYFLLQHRQLNVEFRKSSHEQKKSETCFKIKRQEAKIEKLEGQLQVKDKEIVTITRTEALNIAALKSKTEKLQKEPDEFIYEF